MNASRRRLLASVGAVGATALAGCSGRLRSPDDPPARSDESPPDSDRHIFGATGTWSSVGCNAANNREVGDGDAPVSGLTERWRVPVGFAHREPIVTDGRVYHSTGEILTAYDAADGTRLWRVSASSSPLVREDTVYVGDDSRLRALDVADGRERWALELGERRQVATPSLYDPSWLAVPVGERLLRVNAETGTREWSRRFAGEILSPVPFYTGVDAVVATEAGQVSAVNAEGVVTGEWSLPSSPVAPPVTDSDGIAVTSLDGVTRYLDRETAPRFDIEWGVDTGWTAGIAVTGTAYVAGTHGLTAIDTESGEKRWQHDTGSWQHTAAAYARDTVFCGGDALYAFDPTPSGFGSGPAARFERAFPGNVDAPVVDDGSLYVVAQTSVDPLEHHLLAFD